MRKQTYEAWLAYQQAVLKNTRTRKARFDLERVREALLKAGWEFFRESTQENKTKYREEMKKWFEIKGEYQCVVDSFPEVLKAQKHFRSFCQENLFEIWI